MDTLTQPKNILQFNEVWQSGYVWFMSEIEQTMASPTVSVSIWDLENIFFALCDANDNGRFDYFPKLQIFVENPESGDAQMLYSYVTWDRKTRPRNPKLLIKKIYGDLFKYEFALWTHTIRECHTEILKAHGLSYKLEKVKFSNKTIRRIPLITSKKTVIECAPRVHIDDSVRAFFKHNKGYLADLKRFLNSQVFRL
jgi:hypothetical protein